jgi:hypothetical protein
MLSVDNPLIILLIGGRLSTKLKAKKLRWVCRPMGGDQSFRTGNAKFSETKNFPICHLKGNTPNPVKGSFSEAPVWIRVKETDESSSNAHEGGRASDCAISVMLTITVLIPLPRPSTCTATRRRGGKSKKPGDDETRSHSLL